MSGLIYFSISRIKAAKVSFNKRCHDLICKHNIYTTKGALCAQKLGNGIFYRHFFYTELFRYCPH